VWIANLYDTKHWIELNLLALELKQTLSESKSARRHPADERITLAFASAAEKGFLSLQIIEAMEYIGMEAKAIQYGDSIVVIKGQPHEVSIALKLLLHTAGVVKLGDDDSKGR